MLKIKVNNQYIYISKETSIQMEVNNSIFSTDDIPGEIIYTFDVPAQQNDKIFNFARFEYIQKKKKYEAELLIGGVQIAKGDLYIQKGTKKTYSLGLVVNSFSVGWTEKELNECDYGEIVISKNSTEHKEKFIDFLQSTLKPDSKIKFPLFISENFYGGKNEDFGFYEGKQASIYPTDDKVVIEKNYVNRLFTYNDIVVEELNGSRGVRVFNKDTGKSENSFCFCPAINLLYFIKLFFNKIDINTLGNFFSDKKLSNIFHQSLYSLDATASQFDDNLIGVTIETDKNLLEQNISVQNNNTIFNYRDKIIRHFRPEEDGVYNIKLKINVVLSGDFFDPPFNRLGMYIIQNNYADPYMIHIPTNTLYGPTEYIIPYIFFKNLQASDISYSGAGLYTLSYSFSANLEKNRSYRFFIAQFDTKINIVGFNLFKPTNYDLFDNLLLNIVPNNIFSKNLKINQHVPDLTNGEFINTILKTFGLAFYMDQQKKEVEFSFIKDIYQSSYIQLDNFLLNDKSFIEESDDNEIVYSLNPVNDNEIDESRFITEVEDITYLPDAKLNFGKIFFVRGQNKYVEAAREGDATQNWKYLYQKCSGNNKTIFSGSGEEIEVSPSVLIPNMKDNTHERIGSGKLQIYDGRNDVILEIDKEGASRLYSTNSSSEMILINYTGQLAFSKKVDFKEIKYEHATLVDSDTTNKYDLCVSGENSLGKTFIEPWIHLLANHDPVTHCFLFDLKTFLQVWRLLKPQDLPPEQQTRWVMVGSIKLLPIQMTFQFTEGKDYIFAEIKFAKPRVEI